MTNQLITNQLRTDQPVTNEPMTNKAKAISILLGLFLLSGCAGQGQHEQAGTVIGGLLG